MAAAVLAIGTTSVSTAHAGPLGRWCRKACVDEVDACVAAGGARRACKRELVGSCKTGEFIVCVDAIPRAKKPKDSSLRAPSLQASARSSSTIDLTWIDVNKGESSHIIERSLDPNAGFIVIASVRRNTTAYRDGGLLPSTTYYYRMSVLGPGGAASPYSPVAFATTHGIAVSTTSTSSTSSTSISSTTSTSTSSTTVTTRPPTTTSTSSSTSSTRPPSTTSTSSSSSTSTSRPSTTSTSSSSSTSTSRPPSTTSTSSSSSTSTSRPPSTTSTSTSTSTTSTTIALGQPDLIGFVPGVGTGMDVDVAGGLAMVASAQFGVSAVSVSNPSLPVAVGGADEPFHGLHVARRGARVVATGQTGTGQARLWVLDVTTPTRPRVQGQLATSLAQGLGTGFQRVVMTPNAAYAVAAMGNQGLWVIDVSVPTAPQVRGTLGVGGIAWSVALNGTGTHAYVAAGTGGLKIVSLANPAAPTVVGSAALSGRNYRDVSLVGTVAFLANQNGTLDVYNVANPAAPSGLGAAALTGYGLRVAAEGTTVTVITGLSTGDQLDMFDVTTPSAPVRRSSVRLGAPGTGQGVALSGGFTFVAAADEGMQIYDARMTNPPLHGQIEETYLPRNVAVKGTRAVVLGTYLPTNQLRFKVLDVGEMSAPVVRGQLATTVSSIGSTGIALHPNGNLAVAAMGGSGLWVLDVSVPTAPVVRGTLALGGVTWGVALNSTGTHAYVATGTGGLKIVSLANPAAPALVGSALLTGRNYRDVANVGSLVFLVNQNGTLDIYNVANPAAPSAVGATILTGYGLRVAAEGTKVTVVTGLATSDQLDVIDVSNPSAPVRRSSIVLGAPGSGQGVAVASGHAFVANDSGRLRIYDLANMASPVLRASGLTVGDANSVAVQGGAAYVADFPATLSIIDW